MEQVPHPRLRILGIRGVPNRHSGFESFAEQFAPYLVERGWEVIVYCQDDTADRAPHERDAILETSWRGVRRIHIPVSAPGPRGTIAFDWKATAHAAADPAGGPALVLGYNTALFSYQLRRAGVPSVMNMDGIEWKRGKWGPGAKAWFYVNEWLGCWLSNHLVADHPEIERRLRATRRVSASHITMIPYGSHAVVDADPAMLARFGVTPGAYTLLIARPEPENSILAVVRAYARQRRGVPLVVLGRYGRDVPYQREVLDAASDEVHFAGPVFDRPVVDALRLHARLYVHGHTVGGTNPSLVEALSAGAPVLAHDNLFNRWVCGDAGEYFADEASCAAQIDRLLADASAPRRAVMSAAARQRHADRFTYDRIHGAYERVLTHVAYGREPAPAPARDLRAPSPRSTASSTASHP